VAPSASECAGFGVVLLWLRVVAPWWPARVPSLRDGTLAGEWEMHVLGAPADGEGMGRASRELQPLVFTPDEVAELLCVSRYTVYRLIEQGDIPSVCIGRLRRVRRVDLERWMEEHLSSAS